MLSKLTSNQKILLISAGLIIFIGSLVCVVLISIFQRTNSKEDTILGPIINFEYCGAELEEICLLSFAHDGYGNAVINIFAPDEKFPEFYLNIIRKDGETIYLCMQYETGSSRFICRGETLNLGEQVEIQVLSTDDYELLAQGEFLIKAILVMPQGEGSQQGNVPQPTETNTSLFSTDETIETPEIIETAEISETPEITETSTPDVSYPSYP